MPDTFFSEDQQLELVEAIRLAELNTSGEIRVHLEARCKGDAIKHAKLVFEKLGMHATAQKNGILFYLAYLDRKFAVIGDQGIHENVKQEFWDKLSSLLEEYFKQGEFTDGLTKAIHEAGQRLKVHFPYQSNDTNELSNDLSFGKDGEDA